MRVPMKLYGLTLFESFLKDVVTILGWLLMIFAVAAGVLHGVFETANFAGGLLTAGTFLTGLIFILGSAGLRQNRSALELAYELLLVGSAGWIVLGVWTATLPSVAAGVVLLLSFGFMAYIRRQAIEARFAPKHFNLRQFETVVQVADAMIDGNGEEVLDPIDVAARIDDALDRLETPVKKDISQVLFVVEWLLPLFIAKPFPFSSLGTNDRRHAISKVIAGRGLFRDVSRFLKILSCIGYYGSPEGMRSVGYIPFEERARGEVDRTPSHYDDPIPLEVRL